MTIKIPIWLIVVVLIANVPQFILNLDEIWGRWHLDQLF